MYARISSMGDPGVVTTLAMLWVCGPVAAQTIIPIEQDRSVSNEQVNAPQCSGDFLFDGEAAIGFDPFDAFVQARHGCDSGYAGATASQQSQVDAVSMSATGTATSEAGGPVPGVVHAFGISRFVVTFEVASSSRFSLDGIMSAGSSPDSNVGAIGQARLWEGLIGGVLILEQSIAPGAGGRLSTKSLEGAGGLDPGVYTLDVQAGTFIDNDVPPSRTAQASFDFTFNVAILGDLDGDGTVGILDFLMMLAGWGPCEQPCPPNCPGDLDGDCSVGINDFLILLADWG